MHGNKGEVKPIREEAPMSSAWIFQKAEDVAKLGAEQAPYYVGWYEPAGRRKKKACGTGRRGQNAADKLRRKIEGQLAAGIYRSQLNKTWGDFRAELTAKVLDGMEPQTRRLTLNALDHFGRIVKPLKVHCVGAQHIADFIAARRQEPEQKSGSKVSVATI